PLAGRRAIVTAGPTHEPIDPVRVIANRSSGRQGYAIAAALAQAGAEVTLVSGPTALESPAGVGIVRVETARQMQAAVEAALPADIFVGAAAVADWRPAAEAGHKMKRGGAKEATLTLVVNPDILAGIGTRKKGRPKVVVGFAAETEKLLEHGRRKLVAKGCNLILANDVGAASGVFGGARNRVRAISADGVEEWPEATKDEVAMRLVARIVELLERAP
ncbi:MAG: bifunctional phosphopantothenoylcysteine decarboxylase/phosphopantothenate synthase, partial [Hyphomicrobiales bacterium]|nr:bifunctional phosphopantothenoylcysteine decarboxylase/phosphopantothenate synthase [Hyphomicrobiales bacterium]